MCLLSVSNNLSFPYYAFVYDVLICLQSYRLHNFSFLSLHRHHHLSVSSEPSFLPFIGLCLQFSGLSAGVTVSVQRTFLLLSVQLHLLYYVVCQPLVPVPFCPVPFRPACPVRGLEEGQTHLVAAHLDPLRHTVRQVSKASESRSRMSELILGDL